jgi:hypothetical protein
MARHSNSAPQSFNPTRFLVVPAVSAMLATSAAASA